MSDPTPPEPTTNERLDALETRVDGLDVAVAALAPTHDNPTPEPPAPVDPTPGPTPEPSPSPAPGPEPAPTPGPTPPAPAPAPVDQAAVMSFLTKLMGVLSDEATDAAALRDALADAPQLPPGTINPDVIASGIDASPAHVDGREGALIVLEAVGDTGASLGTTAPPASVAPTGSTATRG
jgi:hypothetical protein